MNTFRKIIALLLLIPVGLILYAIIYPQWYRPNPSLEYWYLLIGLPILVLNYCAWFEPKLFDNFFPATKENINPEAGQTPGAKIALPGFTLQNQWIPMILILTLAVGIVSGAGLIFVFYDAGARPSSGQSESSSVQVTSKMAFRGKAQLPTDAAKVIPDSTPTFASIVVSSESAQAPTAIELQTSETGLPGTPTPTLSPGSPDSTLASVTATLSPLSCVSASQEYLEAVNVWVDYIDTENEIGPGWVVHSQNVENLWFVAAKIYGPGIPGGSTLPAVWAVFVSSDGSIEVYSIDPVAIDYSAASTGQENTPAATMQSSGAQEAYNCAVDKN